MSQPPDDFLSRGVLVCEEGFWKVHADVLDGKNRAFPMEEWQRTAIGWALEKEFRLAKAPWRIGDPCKMSSSKAFPAVHCQADRMNSVASDIRDGHFILRLMRALYRESPRSWTLSAINIGAGIDHFPSCLPGDNYYCNQDDPLDLWVASEALRLVMIDANSYRLQQAMKKVAAQHAKDEPLEIMGLNWVLSPLAVEAGMMDDLLADFHWQVDILKIDVDSYDCALMQAILAKVRPHVLVMESQPLIPPPLKFARAFSVDDPLEHGLIGCSLSYQLQILQPEYQLLVFSEGDAVFVHQDLVPDLEMMATGQLFPWTLYPLRFPVDPVDCFRRSRFLGAHDAADRSIGADEVTGLRMSPPWIPIDFVREWLEDASKMPMKTLENIWQNITQEDTRDSGSKRPLQHVRYILDV